jgi:D-beta-D-heptose 7-phosphate kinase/D-beta-D-heptose 1-phosphate adenosyltransferase
MPLSADPRLTREQLEQLLGRMAARRIVVVGDAMLDIYLSGDADRISPEAPVPVVTVHTERHAPGGAANVAANVAAIGAECRLVAIIGDDRHGESLRAELTRRHLTDAHMIVADARPTTSKTRVTARGQHIVRVDEEIEDPIPPQVERQLLAQLEAATATADAILVEDYDKGALTPALIERIMALAKKRDVPVVVDPKFKHFFAYRGATIFKPNRRELEQAMGVALDLTHPDALPTSLDKLGVDNLLLTLGPGGMVLVTKDRAISRIPTMAREVFDVSGAGDTVTAWVGTAVAAGASVREAAQLANYAAGVEVARFGVATASPAEVVAMHEAHYDQLGKRRWGGLP